MIADYHMHLIHDEHTGKCPYTLDRITEYLRVAEARGIDEIGVSEHCHRFAPFRAMMRYLYEGESTYEAVTAWLPHQFYESLDEYVEVLVRAQQRGWPVKISIEVDYLPGHEEALRELLAPYPWDYIIGSVHYIGTWGIDISPRSGWPERDVDDAYRQYFALLGEAASSRLFDTLAHPDLIKKFGHRPSASLDDLYASVVDRISQAGCAIEVSTAGLHRPVGELYPSDAFLRRLAAAGVPVTFGSDAHRPDDVGRDFAVAVTAARNAGYTTWRSFDRRTPAARPLPETRET